MTPTAAAGSAAMQVIGTPVRGCTLLPTAPGGRDLQPGLLERIPYCGVLQRLSGLDLFCRPKGLQRVPVLTAADEHAQGAG
jgi:hypothetical protein